MEAATANPPVNDTDEDNKLRFRSPDRNLQLVMAPDRDRVDNNGERYTIPGRTIQFENGEYVVRLDHPSGSEAAEQAEKDLAFLRDHHANGSNSEPGLQLFVEVGREPDNPSPGPDSSKVLSRIVQLTAKGDTEGIAEVYVGERSSHSRKDVLAACVTALEALEAEVPPAPLTPEHEVQRVRSTPAVGDTPGVVPEAQPALSVEGGGSTNPAPPAEPTPDHGQPPQDPQAAAAAAGDPETPDPFATQPGQAPPA